MPPPMENPQPARTSFRQRFNLRTELALALLPTAIVLITLVFLDAFSNQHVLFTSLLFAFHDYSEQTLTLFGLALGMTVVLVALQQAVVWLACRHHRGWHHPQKSDT